MAAPIRDRHLHVRGKATGPSSLSWDGDSFLLGPAVRLKVRQPGSGRYRPHLPGAAIVPGGKDEDGHGQDRDRDKEGA